MSPIAQLITFVAGIVTGSVAAAFGSYISYRLQGRIQRNEWARQEERTRQERVEAAERVRHREEEERVAAIRAVALEALWNALSLITFAANVKKSKDARLSPFAFFREQFDRSLPVLAGDSQRLQMVASTYVRGMAFERSINSLRATEGMISMSNENLKEALDLSMSFQVVFRSLGPPVLSKAAMAEFEMTLNVAQIEAK